MSSGPPPAPPADVRATDDDPAPAARRRRRRVTLAVLAAVLVIGTPVGLAIAASLSAPDVAADPRAGGGAGGEAGAADAPDADGAERPTELRRPDPDELTGRDATWAQLLGHVDDSEQAMLAFQQRLERIAADADTGDEVEVDRLTDRIRRAADAGARQLAEVRPRLTTSIGDGAVEEVRVAYLVHHDAWADYLDAMAEEPRLVVGGQDAGRWRLTIDTSGEAFAQQLRTALGSDADPEVRAYARDILRRGFDDPAGTVDT